MGGALFVMILFGIGLVFGPVIAAAAHVELGGTASAIMVLFGALILAVSSIAAVITRLYVRTKASEAFVRTGMGGAVVIQDGGAVVIPVIHEVVRVTLETIRLKVERLGTDSLLTLDNLRADIIAEFYIRVLPNRDDILNAARSLGNKTDNEDAIRALVEDKLVNALRSTAATKKLEDLNTQREEFVKQVLEHVNDDLKKNGFTLEAVTISKLDQAPTKALSDDNIFDARGKRTIAEITQAQRTERNKIERAAEQARLKQDVEAQQTMLALQQQQAEAQARQQAELARIKAEQVRAAQEAQIANEQAVQQAQIEQQQTLALRVQDRERAEAIAKTERERTTALAEQEKAQAVAIAQQESQKAIALASQARIKADELAKQDTQRAAELAAREREIAIAEQNAKLAEAERARLAAEKARTAEEQAVQTVRAVGNAEMKMQEEVIKAQAEAQKNYVAAEKRADADAYTLKKQADAKKAAADADAEAIRKRAEAESTAAKLRAEGEKAAALIPTEVKAREVEIEAQRVAVEAKRIDVLKQELEAREASGKSAQEFELAKLRIQTDATVQIETAKAAATFAQKMDVTLFGSPADLAAMRDSFVKGGKWAQVAEGFAANAGPGVQAAVEKAADAMTDLVAAGAQKLGGKSLNGAA